MKKDILKIFNLQGYIIYKVLIFKRSIVLRVGRPRRIGVCPQCGRKTSKIKQWLPLQRKVHGVLGDKVVYLLLRKREFKCSCGKTFVEILPNVAKWSRKTKGFEKEILKRLSEESFAQVGRKTRLSYHSLRRVVEKLVSPLRLVFKGMEKEKEIKLGIDEHHFKSNKMVITITRVSREKRKRRLLTILPAKRKALLVKFLKEVPERIKEKITEVCTDMDDLLIKAVEETLPKTKIVIDHFHLIQDANKRLDEVRRLEQEIQQEEKGKDIKINPLVFRKAREKLTKRQRTILKIYLAKYPLLAHAYWAKETLRKMYQLNKREEAEEHLRTLILNMEASYDGNLIVWAKTLRYYREYILNYFLSKTTNAYTEGVHRKLKLIQRLSYGFSNVEVYVKKAVLGLLPLSFILSHPNI